MQSQEIIIFFRFNYRDETQIVVRNTKTNGAWGKEERDTPTWPFTPGQPFVMEIRADTDQYVVREFSVKK